VRFHGVGADPEQIRHRFGRDIGVAEMLRCGKEFKLKVRAYRSNWDRLAQTPIPCIAALCDGRYLILGKAAEDKVLVQDPLAPRPATMTRAEFEAVWDGRLVLMAGRANLLDLARRFDVT
jgi:subfamily B ATP-binding cassette protein HlyB/CyaB